MTTDADLASWGEPPSTPAEEALAELLGEALEFVRAEGATDVPARTGTRAESGDELFETLTWLEDFASSIRENIQPAHPADPELTDPFPGEFRLTKLLAEGAFGKVWLADDLLIGRQVALKMLKPPRRTAGDVLAALRNEARLLDRVRHPNIVHIYTVRQAAERYYLVLQYVAGGSLEARLKAEGPLPWQRACRYVADVAEALLCVHAQGIVHRDVKPGNILWDPDKDEAVLTDFGISCRLADAEDVAGTLAYLAPEAFEGRVTPGLDVFALAATLFQLTTGEIPFPARDEVEYVGRVMDGLPAPDPRCSVLPGALEQLLHDGLAPASEDRPTLKEFVHRLRGTLNRLLADNMCLPAALSVAAPANLRLLVDRDDGQRAFRSMPALRSVETPLRDPERVPPLPERVRLRTGDRIRIQVSADRPGYVTVFNIGPTGNLHLLWPDDKAPPPRVEANRPFDVLHVEVTPPPGRERLVAAWSRQPLPIAQMLQLARGGGDAVSGPYRATRDLERVDQSMRQLAPEDWHAVVLELDHEE